MTKNKKQPGRELPKSSVVQMVLKYAWKSRKAFMIMLLAMIAGSIFSMIVPRITESIINGLEAGDLPKSELYLLLLGAVLLSLASAIITGVGRYSSAKVGTKAIYYLRSDVYNAINRQSFSYYDKTETGQLVARATSDIDTTSGAFSMGITLSIQSGMTMIMALIGITLMLPSIAWIAYVGVGLYVLIVAITTTKMRPVYLESREKFGELTTTTRENILGANVVRIFNAQKKEKGKFEVNNGTFRDLTIETIKLQTILRYTGRTVIGLMGVAGFYLSARLYAVENSIAIGTLVAFLGYVTMLMMPLHMLNGVIINFVAADAAMIRVKDVLDSMPEVVEKPNALSAKNIKGKVEFKNVDFGYTSTLVLKDITFTAEAGSKMAILGTTGSGKSTLISLLPRFYDVTNGSLLIDGTDVKDYILDGEESIRSQIGVCSQNIFLFNTTIAENIKFGKEETTRKEVIEAAKSANIHEFIHSLPEGYDTIVGERGHSLSGGQKQRIAIARALVIQPKILILDDSTSAVDVETEFKIQQALEKIMVGRTSFIITQRLSTIRNAEKILVMDQGRVVGIGSHDDLYENNPLYRQIYETLYVKQKKIDEGKSKVPELMEVE
ncbi:MAG: ABC transporter ATP-binding protein [Promethearchaeota archaeon]